MGGAVHWDQRLGPEQSKAAADAMWLPELLPLLCVEQVAQWTNSCFECIGAKKGQINLWCLYVSFYHPGVNTAQLLQMRFQSGNTSGRYSYLHSICLKCCVSVFLKTRVRRGKETLECQSPLPQGDQIRLWTNILNYLRQFFGPPTFEKFACSMGAWTEAGCIKIDSEIC